MYLQARGNNRREYVWMTRLAELTHATLLAGAVGFALASAAQAQEIGKTKGKPSPDVKKPISFFMTPTAQRNFRQC